MWVFNIFMWMLMQIDPEIQENQSWQLWFWLGPGQPTMSHPRNLIR